MLIITFSNIFSNLVIKSYPPAKQWQTVYEKLVELTFLNDPMRPTWISFREWKHSPTRSGIICKVEKVASTSLNKITKPLTIPMAARLLASLQSLRYVLVRHPVSRFLSWYNDKILGDCHGSNRTADYNKILLNKKDSSAYSADTYALAIHKLGARNLDPHQRSFTQMCLFGSIHYDIVGRLEDLPKFMSRIATQTGDDKQPQLPHKNSAVDKSKKSSCSQLKFNDLDNSTIHTLAEAYEEDFLWFKRLGVPYNPYVPYV